MRLESRVVYQAQKFPGYIQNINGTSLEMILIPGGKFMMGSPLSEAESHDVERPLHLVTVKSFCMGRYPVTQAQWRAVANLPEENRELKLNPSEFLGDQKPVDSVSWYDAVEFCARLSRYSGRNYRLPSEAEWEYACRAGTTTPFYFGETISTTLANYDASDQEKGAYGRGVRGESKGKTTEVGSFDAANAFGLHDLHGNVWEWCADPWHDNYEGAPNQGEVWDENHNYYYDYLHHLNNLLTSKNLRILRGGSWKSTPMYCRSAVRNDKYPDYNFCGFRVAVSPLRSQV